MKNVEKCVTVKLLVILIFFCSCNNRISNRHMMENQKVIVNSLDGRDVQFSFDERGKFNRYNTKESYPSEYLSEVLLYEIDSQQTTSVFNNDNRNVTVENLKKVIEYHRQKLNKFFSRKYVILDFSISSTLILGTI